MPRTWDQAELERYIREGIEESLTLDYKAGEALLKGNGRQAEIAKDVSAMANSAGGIIIYGISEHNDRDMRHRAAGFSPVDRRECSKETLEQIISSNIEPRLSNVKIYPVPLDNRPHDVLYVVSIPQSDTVHQVVKKKRYYKRFNFESVPMEDYEIRDVMNRSATPAVEPRVGHVTRTQLNGTVVWDVPLFTKNKALVVAKDTAMTVEFLEAVDVEITETERFQLKTRPKPTDTTMYIATFSEAIHRGINKYFGTFRISTSGPQAIRIRLQIFANGMRAKFWIVRVNLGSENASVQVLEDGYLY